MEREPEIEAVHRALVREGVVAPLAFGGPDERAWLDCDLASLAENRLRDVLDPRDLDDARRADWLSRAVDEPPLPLQRRSRHEQCYWLLEGGRRAGTIALANDTFGGRRLHVASFYVFPPYRRTGVGRRAMESVQAALARQDLGLRLDTSWCWQPAVRFYLRIGLWVQMWKRDLVLCSDPRTPPPRIEVGEETASLSVPRGDAEVTLARAHRRGNVLELEEAPRERAKEEGIGEAYWHAPSTLALALALEGWPLVRSQERWEKCHYADGGPPEALAYKIALWEAWDRKHGWAVSTPRIPGLEYPTWDELEARWKAESRVLGIPDPAG